MKTVLFTLFMLITTFMTAASAPAAAGQLQKATFAGGCFWCMEHPFDELPGVVSVMVQLPVPPARVMVQVPVAPSVTTTLPDGVPVAGATGATVAVMVIA